jgi:hypothetical protein
LPPARPARTRSRLTFSVSFFMCGLSDDASNADFAVF